jgi:DNA-binding transcriptional ArsR family regulator
MKKLAEFDDCAQRLKALADPHRLRLIQILFDGPSSVSNLCDSLDERIVKVSHHLQVLRNIGIVQAQRRGRHIIYSIAPDVAVKKPGQINLGCCQLDLLN